MRSGQLRRLALAMLPALLAVPAAGCGGDDGEQKQAAKERAPARHTTLKLESPGGANKYDKKRLVAPAGKVTLDFTNDSDRPHNLIVIPGAKLDYKKKAVASVRAISRHIGETRLRTTATLRPGTYTYYCSIQNHAALGMRGRLVVR